MTNRHINFPDEYIVVRESHWDALQDELTKIREQTAVTPLIEQRAVLAVLEELRGDVKSIYPDAASKERARGIEESLNLIDARIAALKETTT